MYQRIKFFSLLIILINSLIFSQSHTKDYQLLSPDKKIVLTISVTDKIEYAVKHLNTTIISPSPISLTLEGGLILGVKPVVKKNSQRTINEVITPVVAEKNKVIPDHCQELTLAFKGNYSLIFRAYNDGVAYRFVTDFKNEIKIMAEQVCFQFAADHQIYFPEEDGMETHQERIYHYIPLSQVTAKKIGSIPALVEIANGPKVLLTEADLFDYAGFYLTGSESSSTQLVAKFPYFVLRDEAVNDRDVKVRERADFIAKTSGQRAFPWRVVIIAAKDGDLIESQMVYKLASPLKLKDVSWIKPGKVAWDWWNANNIYGVDFRAGVNTATYKYYIDFAAKYGLEYIILDEGWYKLGDLMAINPEIDMEALLAYAKQKNVGVILWVVWKTLENQLEPALAQFEKWGVRGIKVDFMQRDDQAIVQYYWRIAEEAAKRKLLVDYHGAYKPAGLRRAYPNVITREGVKGMENSKWSEDANPENGLIIPFTRMVAGPMDYTPGAMLNAQKRDFRSIFNVPMSQGTRCHQLALYVVYESPLQMLSDSPSNYLKEPECMEFLAKVPTVWDETKVLAAKVSDYVLIARKNGADWYVGALTDWTPRELEVDFSFLGAGTFQMDCWQDGINADRIGIDYKKVSRSITAKDKLIIKLAPGGGWAARIHP